MARPLVPEGFEPEAVVERLRGLAEAGDREGIRRDLTSLIPDHEAHAP